MNARSVLQLLLISAALGVSLTGFYLVHERLPRAVRAPTSIILAPVAIVDGLCRAIGVPGIYGRIVPVLVVNWAFGVAICCGVARVGRRR
jgi:uncharacterized membrane protein